MYAYLLQVGVLHGSDEEILCAKQTYRKQYKRNWKQQKRPRKELRIEVTLKEFAVIKSLGLVNGLKPTTYARTILLASTGQSILIPYKDDLLQVLQLLSMAAIASRTIIPARDLSDQLFEAERLLLQYLSR